MICDIHQEDMRQFTKEGRSWYSHKTDDGWCNGKPKVALDESDPIDKAVASNYPKAKVVPEVDWDAKDRQSMAQTAMKAASEVLAAQINAKYEINLEDIDSELKRMANE